MARGDGALSTTSFSCHRRLVLASRGSPLARVQTNQALDALQAFEPHTKFSAEFIQSGGDVNKSTALYLIGGKALWTKELEVALKETTVDFLAHSLKDVPTTLPDGCMIGAVLERADPADSLVIKQSKRDVWRTLDDIPAGSVIGTGSIRRIAQLKRRYPLLEFADCRGNIDSRLAKLDDENGKYSALVLAKAGLVRLGLGHRIAMDLTPPLLFHAVSQGAIGVEIRNDDPEALRLCEAITHRTTHLCCFAERACLRVLEGGCSVPVGVASKYEDGVLEITGCVTSLDASRHVEHTVKGAVDDLDGAEALGAALAKTLVDMGARGILEEINVDREQRALQAEKVEKVATS